MATLKMKRGDYREYTVTATTAYDAAAVIHFAVKSEDVVDAVDSTDSNALFTVDADSSDAVDNADGTVTYTLVIDETKTAGKTPGDYTAEVEYVDGLGRSTTYPSIKFVLQADVNQRT